MPTEKKLKKLHVALVQTSLTHTFAKLQTVHMAWFCGTNATNITNGQQQVKFEKLKRVVCKWGVHICTDELLCFHLGHT
jgi:hypothetical protein